MNKSMTEDTNQEEISLKEIVEKIREWYLYLLSNWKIIILAGIIGALIGLTYSFIKKPIYTATLTFALEDEGSGGGGLGSALGLASQFGFDLGGSGGGAFEGANLIELFKSRKIVQQTLFTSVKFNGLTISLAEMYIQDQGWRKKWDKRKLKNLFFLPENKRNILTRQHDSILGIIYKNISENDLSISKRDKKIDIITIEMLSDNEFFAKSFTEALVKEVSMFYIDTKSKKSRMNMDILKKQTDSIRGALNAAITGVAVANDNTFNLNPSLNVRRTPSARKQVDVQANTAILTELVKQTEIAKVTVRKETPLIQIIDQPIYPLKKEKFGKAKGIILGGVLAGFFIILYLIIKRFISELKIN